MRSLCHISLSQRLSDTVNDNSCNARTAQIDYSAVFNKFKWENRRRKKKEERKKEERKKERRKKEEEVEEIR